MGEKSIPANLVSHLRDYSKLPSDQLLEIAENIDSQIERVQFRSVCQSWRSYVNPVPSLTLVLRYPFVNGPGPKVETFPASTLYESTIYIIRPHDEARPECSSKCWLIKVQQTSSNRRKLLNPLSQSRVRSLPKNHPVNISGFKVSAVGKEYYFQSGVYLGKARKNYPHLSSSDLKLNKLLERFLLKKVVMSPNASANNFIAMAIHFNGKLMFIKSGDAEWTIFEGQEFIFHDLMHYKGKFYAVNSRGRTYIVCPHASILTQAVNPVVNGGQRKRLVNSRGDLFLVDVHMNDGMCRCAGVCHDAGHYWRWAEISKAFEARLVAKHFEDIRHVDHYICGAEDFIPSRFDNFYVPSSCKVFKLNEENQSWIQVESLGDQIFFVGDQSSFSISASNLLPGTKGNCVLYADYCFMTDFFFRAYADALKHDIRVFNLEDGSFTKLENFPSYLELFLPTPTWFR